MARDRKLFPTLRLILLAALAGVVAGAVAVYVRGGPSGNVPQPQPAAAAQVSEADIAACAAKTDKAKAVGAAATGTVAAMLPADPPQSLKRLAFNDPQGKPMTLSALSGKTLLVNLWATWCAPCRSEMPALDALQKTLGGPDFQVVAINVDTGDDTKPNKFLEETKVSNLARFRDNTLGVFDDLKTRGLALGLPATLLVDADGCLLAHMNGPADWASEDAKALVASARSQKTAQSQ
jgi:thiol-disulfide isomerase/thioredoxin